MKNKFNKVLLIYKKSAYSIYFMERKIQLAKSKKENLRKEIVRFQKAHDEHYKTLQYVESALSKYNINYSKCFRGGKVNYSKYDLVITLGGDGTFLEAARNIKKQVIVGINSAPGFSVGKLCVGNRTNFDRIAANISKGTIKINHWPKLCLQLEDNARPIECVNDILICHKNPAAMSRYYIKVGQNKEEHRNSGIWIATPAGSSGAIKSAGGKMLNLSENKIQYMPRELYYGFSKNYKLKGAVLKSKQSLEITSLMRAGMIYIDGTHYEKKFPFNSKLKISFSPNHLNIIAK